MPEREAVTAEALGALYARYRVSLTATARHALLARGVPESVVSAEDVVQDAFAKALRDPAAIEHPVGYLRTVIRTEVANRARREASRGRTDARRTADPLRFDPTRAADFSSLIVNRCAVEQALAGLSLPQRTAVWATKALDFTQSEAATLMGKAPGTVATHVSRGMVLLRASLVTAVAAGIVWLAGRFTGDRPRRTDAARVPGEGTGAALPARWWQEGRATLMDLYERRPPVAALALSLVAACGILWWIWRRFLAGRAGGTFSGGRLSVRRTRRAWTSATNSLGLPFTARGITRDAIVFTAPADVDPDAVAEGAERVALHMRRKLGRTVRLELSGGPTPRKARLTDLLALTGWTRGELARLANRQAAAMGHPHVSIDASRVGRWIDTLEVPRDPVPRVLAALFTERLGRVVSVEDLGLTRHGHAGKPRDGDDVPWAPERTAAVLTEFTGMDLMLNRRGLVGAGATLAAGSAVGTAMHDWLHNTEPDPDREYTLQPLPLHVPMPMPEHIESAARLLPAHPHHATQEALKILEVVTHAPHGAASRAQIAHSLKTFGPAETAALTLLLRQGYLRRLPDNRYTASALDPMAPSIGKGEAGLPETAQGKTSSASR